VKTIEFAVKVESSDTNSWMEDADEEK